MTMRLAARLGLGLILAQGGPLPPQAAEAVLSVAKGERLALVHCGRCHVVNDKNRFGGIGSTPSFAALRALPQADDRFAAFWTFNPHPAFMQVEGMTTPFDPGRPPTTAPVILTRAEAEAIAAFAASIPPLDLGAPVRPR